MDKIDLIHDHSYRPSRSWVAAGNEGEFKYPCANNINAKNEVSCVYYSSRNDKGHFGIPKVIFGAYGAGVFIDNKGEWGCCQNVAAIPAPVEDLPKIKKALQNPEFLDLMEACIVSGNAGTGFPMRTMKACLKKDFWKEFCDE